MSEGVRSDFRWQLRCQDLTGGSRRLGVEPRRCYQDLEEPSASWYGFWSESFINGSGLIDVVGSAWIYSLPSPASRSK